MRTIRASSLQLQAHDRADFQDVADDITQRAERAARSCDLLVLPEGTFPAYVLGDALIDDSAVNAAITALQTIACDRACVIVAGVAARRDARLYNSAVVIDRDGTIAGTADKAFLWHFDRKWFAAGDALEPIRTSIGNLGVLICADGRMPGIARALVDRGAELLVMPTAWVTSGRDPQQRENIQADLLARVRAFENAVPFVAANKCGVERGMVAYCGKSQIISADGTLLAIASEDAPDVISAEIVLGSARPYRHASPVAHVIERASQVVAGSVRVAITMDDFPADIGERLECIDADAAINPSQVHGNERLNRVIPSVALDSGLLFDPATLPPLRMDGVRLVIARARSTHPWLERIARARALELRLYVIVFDEERDRAYAIDPDGVIVAGTFDNYRLASFPLDSRRTSETGVAPGTDIAVGIERIAAITGSAERQ